MSLIIGITGSIAAGKSSLCKQLVEEHGAVHVDADREIHHLYAPGTPGFDRVTAEFGIEIVGTDGIIDRRKLGALVFGNPERMEALRTAIGDISAHFMRLLKEWQASLADEIGIFEAVNLLQNDYMTHCDAAWLVVCEDETAVVRMMVSRELSREEAEQRLASARDWRESAPLSDCVFHNDRTLGEFHDKVEKAFNDTVYLNGAGALLKPRWHTARNSS